MTMHADQLVGAPVTDSDGLAVGTVEQVFRDDVDGTPSWARIRSAKGLHFVPLAGSKMTSGGGLSVPFDSPKIMGEPGITVDRHMSVDQEEQLRQYFGINLPTQPAQPAQETTPPTQRTRETARSAPDETGGEWLIRSEERFAVNLETRESGRVTLHKFVDTEPVRETVRVFHEEYEVERIPISDSDQLSADQGGAALAERDQEIILHETRARIGKETVPVERVRLSVRRVEEDQVVDGELRKERIEIEDSGAEGPAGEGSAGS